FSYAFPTDKEIPIVLDIATSVAAEGKLRVKLSKGEQIPEGWIIDKDGNPSRNPADYYKGGALLPLGGDDHGHKGFGLGLVAEVLAGILSRAGCAYETNKRGNGVFFAAIDIQSFLPVDEFKREMDNLIRAMKSSRLRSGFNEILIPGEPEFRTEQIRLKEGIYVPEKTWEEITILAKQLNLDVDKITVD
ncbi:MAG: Ldh family oxidoreductase, partial [Candidatus Bathyarchaeia archaeon]